ncbi:SRPBCC family protein [Streptomyces sp. NBC_01190]|uniref:SRPBCC family protein n=1 Tax=Streptomyces sp. NBC_01190 TaxID=2903767 RepID=UPI00386356DC|nr:SRPBCC family protein [Streptomyces sp. NBC_01190]
MAADQESSATDQSPMDLLKQEVRQYLGARAKHLAKRAGGKLADATEKLTGDGGGTLPEMGSRVLRGESPVKAVAGAKTKEAKEKVTGKVKEAVGGGGGSGGGGGGDDLTKNPKSSHVIETIDVGVPLRFAYDHWTEFETFSDFTKGVRQVERGEETTTEWTVKIGPSTRNWKATVQEQIPDDRIVWTTEGAAGNTQGAVSFHEITPTLTRIVLVMVYLPSGIVEKTGNIWRAQGRRIRLDFKNFQQFVTFVGEEAEGWRGEIRDGEVVKTHEDAMAEEEEEEGAEDDEDGEGEEDEEDLDEEDAADDEDDEDADE